PAGVGVAPRADRELARTAAAVGRGEPDGRPILVERGADPLDGEGDRGRIRRQACVGRDREPVEIVGARGSRGVCGQGSPYQFERAAGDSAESTDYYRRAMPDQLSLALEPALPNAPTSLRPMLARPLAAAFDSPNHLFEPVWGGIRALARIGPAEAAGAGDVVFIDEAGAE